MPQEFFYTSTALANAILAIYQYNLNLKLTLSGVDKSD